MCPTTHLNSHRNRAIIKNRRNALQQTSHKCLARCFIFLFIDYNKICTLLCTAYCLLRCFDRVPISRNNLRRGQSAECRYSCAHCISANRPTTKCDRLCERQPPLHVHASAAESQHTCGGPRRACGISSIAMCIGKRSTARDRVPFSSSTTGWLLLLL